MNSVETNILKEAYSKYEHDYRLKYFRTGVFLGLAVMVSGISLDWITEKEFFAELVKIRIAFGLAIVFLLFLVVPPFSKYIKYTVLSLPILINAATSLQVVIAGGAMSPYYVGICLVLFAAGVVPIWNHIEISILCVITLIIYTLACVAHPIYYGHDSYYWFDFFNNFFFLLTTSVICILGSYYRSISRYEEFRLNFELEERNKEMEALDRMKSQFFANVSHELRTPLTLILGPVQDLLQTPGSVSDKAAEMLRATRDNALRLLRLVNDLLDVIKLEEGRMELKQERVELNGFLSGITDSVSHLMEIRELQLDRDINEEEFFITADISGLEKVFLNLLSNAIKFTDDGGTIGVATRSEGERFFVTVKDSGIGIGAHDLPYIFDRFRQADGSSTRKYQGTGLGLALVKELVEKMQGTVEVTSEVGKGTTFVLSFPMAQSAAVIEAPDNDAEPLLFDSENDELVIARGEAGHVASFPMDVPDFMEDDFVISEVDADKETVLVVDDEPDMRQYITKMLGDDYQVLQAKDGKEGLEMAFHHKPNLMVLDLMLPEIDGLEVCRRLKEADDTRAIKIILLTARVDEKAKLTALENGADDFLTKPFSSLEVKSRIRNLLSTTRLENFLEEKNAELEAAITELKSTQSQLIHSEKINALGNLAAGLLHEVNNPLNYSMTALQLLTMEVEEQGDEDTKEIINDINDGMGRIRNIITDLKSFAYPSKTEKLSRFSFSKAVASTLRISSHEIRDVQVVQQLDDSDEVMGSESHIVQVLVNLLTNAAKAMTKAEEGHQGEIIVSSEAKGGRLYVQGER